MTGTTGLRIQRRRTRIAPAEELFLNRSLSSENSVQRKLALQRLCSLYRAGGRLTSEMSVKASVFACLTDPDPKVRRWAFNALAQFGSANDVPIMQGPWQKSRNEEEVFDAGLTALARILPREGLAPLLNKADVALGPRTLLALAQQSSEYKSEIHALHINIDTAASSELRSATLLVGLVRAPDTLFSPRHPISDVIGDLNKHPDAIVAQYSFWAKVEHPNLGLADCKVSPRDFLYLPPNAQGWACRLLTKRGEVVARHHEFIVSASESDHAVVREGMAAALRDVYYDGLEAVVLDWHIDEDNALVRDRLLEHMSSHSGQIPEYREVVISAYRSSAPNSILRSRLEAANRDDKLSLDLRKIALETGDPDLFKSLAGGGMTIINVGGSAQVGGISGSGTGNSGQFQFSNSAADSEQVLRLLMQILGQIEALPRSQDTASIQEVVTEAVAKPSRLSLENVVGKLKSLRDGGEAAHELGSIVSQGYERLRALIPDL